MSGLDPGIILVAATGFAIFDMRVTAPDCRVTGGGQAG